MEPLWAHSARRDASTGRRPCLVLGLLAVVGCNSGRQLQTDLYQRELRLQEDEIYRLEDCIEEYQAIVRDYRCELAELKRAGMTASPAPTPAVEPLPEPVETAGTAGLPGVPEPIDLGPPATTDEGTGIDLEEAPVFDDGGEAPAFEGAQLGTADHGNTIVNTGVAPIGSNFVPASTNPTARAETTGLPPNPYPHAANLKPLPTPSFRLSETIGLGVHGGDDQTLVVRIAEQTRAWLADFDGEASVMLTDPAVDGQLRRIARWDFTRDEVQDARMTSSDPAGTPEIVLPIALPTETPVGQPLRLWVRLVDAKGNKTLQATEVRFADGPLRLAAQAGIASVPRRLPATGLVKPPPMRDRAIVVAAPQAMPPEDAWRAAQEARPRRLDPAIQTASFETLTDSVR